MSQHNVRALVQHIGHVSSVLCVCVQSPQVPKRALLRGPCEAYQQTRRAISFRVYIYVVYHIMLNGVVRLVRNYY